MKIKKLTRPLEVKSITDDGVFEGYGSVFNVVDSYREVVLPGAFEESLDDHKAKGSMPALLWQHDASHPVGVFDQIAEDSHGLRMTGRLALGTQKGKEAYELLKMGAVKGLSIGFSVPKGGEEYDDEKQVLNLSKINLWETSIVTFPANKESQITAVRAALDGGSMPSVRDFERYLMQDAGFTRSDARQIINNGYKSLVMQDAGSDAVLNVINEMLRN